jgi:SAM-dependent methyltransferase
MTSNHHELPCPACGSCQRQELLTLPSVPVLCHVRYEDAREAKSAPMGEIALVSCAGCGLVYNRAFDPESIGYGVPYDNALHFSEHFRCFADRLASDLCRRHGLHGKTIVEIGCGDGYFLNLLCSKGDNRGIGYDPTQYQRCATVGAVQLVQGYFTPETLTAAPDLICCRHVLEHLPEPRVLLRQIREVAARSNAVVFFEVPDGRFTFEHGGVWDILYEHCSYYTGPSLRRLFEQEGFRVLRLESAYQNQFLQIEAIVASPAETAELPSPAGPHAASDLGGFVARFSDTVGRWQQLLAKLASSNRPVAVWGAGTKGVMFLNLAARQGGNVSLVVDINPGKQGSFVAGAGQPVVAPSELRSQRPEVVIAMNPNYRGEIAAELHRLGIQAELMVA